MLDASDGSVLFYLEPTPEPSSGNSRVKDCQGYGLPGLGIVDMGDESAGSADVLPVDTGDGISTPADAATNEPDIKAVIDQVSALRTEIDRLIGLVNSALKKVED
jgi:hypothetical protein